MNKHLENISVIEPVGNAIDWTKKILFTDFDGTKWMAMAFCAWLATLGSGGFNFNISGSGQPSQYTNLPIHNAPSFLLPLILIGAPILLGLFVLLLWVSSRGEFMFLGCVAENKGEVKKPWKQYKIGGNSLFLFRLLLYGGILVFILFLVGGIAAFAHFFDKGLPGGVVGFALFSVIFISMTLLFSILAIVVKFTVDFVVPIMYVKQIKVIDAWKDFLGLLKYNKMSFFLYLLFQIVIFLAVIFLIMLAVLLTCCCAGILLALPYINAVILLPVHSFIRSYSVFFLRQFGSEYDVFKSEIIEAEIVE